MYGLVELWQHTDRTQRSICEEHDIKPHVFSYWGGVNTKQLRFTPIFPEKREPNL